MPLLRLPEAAQALGISFPTLKQWIYRRKIRSVRTAGGHHRIPSVEIDRLLFQEGGAAPARGKGMKQLTAARRAYVRGSMTGLEQVISGRNQLVGRVVKLETVGLLAKVCLDIGGQTVTAIITRDAARGLGLKVGDTAAALIKATEVMIIRPMGPERSLH
jgi:molybdopterin-binding protein